MYKASSASAYAPTFPDYPPTVPELLRAGTQRFGGRDCVVTPEDRLSYAELDETSRRLAARLVVAGIGKGSRVGVLLPNGCPWVQVWAAASRIGAVVIPVNTFYQPPELARFLRHSDIETLVAVGSFAHHDYLDRLEQIAPELASAGPGPLLLPSLPQLRQVLLWEASERAWAQGGLGEAVGGSSPRCGGERAGEAEALVDALGEDVHPSDVMLVTYTSGTTGEPKGVVHSHGALVRHARNLAQLSELDESARVWTPMPLCWVGGFAFTLLRAMSVGACFVTQELFEPASALALMERERITHVSAWPAVSKALTEHPNFATTDLSTVRGGALYDAMPASKRPRDPSLVVSSLGMSETCGPHTFWYPGEDETGAPEAYRGTFGHEVPGTEHRIVDPDTGADLPEGEEGEVLVRGYNLMLNLYKKERSEVFDADGWYHTGDRGYFKHGWFFFTGRQSDLIKTSGSNVSPAEVEAYLQGVEEVKLAFVVGVPHPERGQDVVALLVPWGEAASLDLDALRRRMRSSLSSYKVPRHFFLISDAEVPWLVSQKADRAALAALAEKLVARAGGPQR
jgi:acyl-CoA synthetase (AMP-forming)/AMP-acid ligase II